MTEENYQGNIPQDDGMASIDSASQEELISIYIYALMEEKGENPEDKEAHVALRQQVVAMVNDAIIDALPEAQTEEMNKLFEQNEATPEKISEIVAGSGVDTQAITEETLDKFRAEYLGEKVEEIEVEEVKEEM